MNRMERKPEMHRVDGREMTAVEIAQMLGITKNALRHRRNRLGGISMQAVVNMYRENQFGSYHDRAARYLIDGQWMTRTQIAEKLGVSPVSLSNRRCQRGESMAEAVEHFRQWNESGRKKNPLGNGGRPAQQYRVGSRYYTIPGVARKYGVAVPTVRRYVYAHGMAEALKHYQGRGAQARAEKEIMRILGY